MANGEAFFRGIDFVELGIHLGKDAVSELKFFFGTVRNSIFGQMLNE